MQKEWEGCFLQCISPNCWPHNKENQGGRSKTAVALLLPPSSSSSFPGHLEDVCSAGTINVLCCFTFFHKDRGPKLVKQGFLHILSFVYVCVCLCVFFDCNLSRFLFLSSWDLSVSWFLLAASWEATSFWFPHVNSVSTLSAVSVFRCDLLFRDFTDQERIEDRFCGYVVCCVELMDGNHPGKFYIVTQKWIN